MKKIKLLILCFIIQFNINSQINMFDNNGKKHGEWIENNQNRKYYHGKEVGKIESNQYYTIYDSLGNKIENGEYLNKNKSILRRQTVYYKGEKIKEIENKLDNATNQIILYKSLNYIDISKDSAKLKLVLDGVQTTFNGTALNETKIEDYFSQGIPQKTLIYYPKSNIVFIEYIYKKQNVTTLDPNYTDIPDKITIFHENGNILTQFNPKIFYGWTLFHNSVITGAGWRNFYYKLGPYFPKLKSLHFENSYLTDDSNFDFQKHDANLDSTVNVKIYDFNGKNIETFKFVKTNFKNSANPSSSYVTECKVTKSDYEGYYALDGVYKAEINDSYGKSEIGFRKYYKGMEDSIWIQKDQYKNVGIYEFERGNLKKNESYVMKESYNSEGVKVYKVMQVIQVNFSENGNMNGSFKKFYLSDGTVEETIYSEGKKISAPPVRNENFTPMFPEIYNQLK